MTYYSCKQCGEMINISDLEGKPRREHCPVCDEQTLWTTEFEAEEGTF